MMKTIRSALLGAVVALAFAVQPVAAETFSLTTGVKGGSYHGVFGVNLASVLAEYGYKAQVQTSKGSVQNADRVAAGEALIGFTQADAYASWLAKHPEKAANTEIVGTLGKECIYVAVRDDGAISDEDDIGKATKIAVQKKGSGSAESWGYLQQLEDDYAEASTHFVGGARAMSQLKTNRLDAVLWVTSPDNLNHKYLRMVQMQGSGLKLIDVDDYSLNNKLPNGQQVYEFSTVDVEKGFMADAIKTPCTDILVIANTNMDEEMLETVAEIMAMNTARITGK